MIGLGAGSLRTSAGLLFDPRTDTGNRRLDYVVSSIGRVESRDQILARTSGLDVITDDNMGTERDLP